jgi:threonine aldolase
VIDLRSDVCAPPTEEMWAAMRAAPVGSASLGEDVNVRALERLGAELLGKEAALFTPTCTAANLVAVLALAPPGGRAAIDERAHIVVNEGGWLTEVAGLTPVGLDEEADVVCLENTHTRRGGTLLTAAETAALAAGARRAHLDGARLPNAAVALGVPLAELAAPCDTVAVSLNKGLCAPYGALLAGDGETIAAARVQLKRLGGGTVHKAGLFAAAGILALERMLDRLAEDHRRARALAAAIGAEQPQTNLVYADIGPGAVEALAARGVLALALEGRVRFATHRGVGDDDVERAAGIVRQLTAVA